MTKAKFVAEFSELLTDLEAVRGSLHLEEAERRGSDWDEAGTKQGAQLAAYFWDRFDRDTNEYLLARIREYVNDAIFCREAQKLKPDPDHANCRPIVTIGEHGSPTCEMER
ncbi:MAG TPA: hypothetical protein VF710_14975 [Longimicrobium sp.]|jgi:hypothetical protein